MNESILRKDVEKVLNELAEQLDVPPSKYEEARDRYDAVGRWLDASDSSLHIYKPEIYPQGSFALGTVVKPINDEDYDVDAVCRLNSTPQNISQKRLKAIVGDRLKEHGKYSQMLDPKDGGRRCWTLKYAEGARFHLDILPAIPDEFHWLIQQGVPEDLARHAIKITDKSTWDYSNDWPKSNPMGYVLWFKARTRVRLDEQRRLLAMEKRARIEDIQDYEVRTPLQRLIQILKRHRDIQYADDEDKPISIIISTLAATLYQSEPTILEALLSIVPRMRLELQRNKRGAIWWVPNPVNPKENFADRWEQTPRKADIFFEWLNRVEAEHRNLLTDNGFSKVGEYLTEAYGPKEASKALEKYATHAQQRSMVKYGSVAPIADSVKELTTFDVPQKQRPRWPIIPLNSVNVSAQWKKTGGWQPLSNNGRYVMKNSDLRFTAKTNVEKPYQVFWQVVNTGRDARLQNQLRGSFEPPTSDAPDQLIRDETTKYRGRHWIECFIVKGEMCVARSGEFIVNVC